VDLPYSSSLAYEAIDYIKQLSVREGLRDIRVGPYIVAPQYGLIWLFGGQ
jgi:hypothetical protein